MITITQFLILLCVYVVLESLHPVVRMPGGFKLLCPKFKYTMVAMAAVVFIYHMVKYGDYTTKDVFATLAFVVTVMPRMIWRIKKLGHVTGKFVERRRTGREFSTRGGA
jgi:hypothetical protein